MPFQAIRYNADKINGPVSKVVAPPYDVIDFEQQDALYKSSPHNVVRLILARQYDGDSPTDNRYTRAAKSLDAWLNEGVLHEDPRPALHGDNTQTPPLLDVGVRYMYLETHGFPESQADIVVCW